MTDQIGGLKKKAAIGVVSLSVKRVLVQVIFTMTNIFLVWLLVAIAVTFGGFAIFKFSQGEFFKLAVGLPILLIGASLGFFKIHEIILVVVRPQRLKALCLFCSESALKLLNKSKMKDQNSYEKP